MKKLLIIFILFLCGYGSFAQWSAGNDSTRYIWSKNQYGIRQPRMMADNVMTPPKDTIYSKDGIAMLNDKLYVGNGTRWVDVSGLAGGGSGIDSATYYLGTLCFWTLGASTCYDLSKTVCFSTNSADALRVIYFNCLGDSLYTLRYPIKYLGADYPFKTRTVVDTIFGGVDVLQGQNGLLFGGVVSHDTLYTYDVTAAIYSINGVQYSSSSGSTTLSPSDASFDRQDIIALDTNGNIINITGTPGADPQLPQIDPLSQVFLTSIYVKALSTGPEEVNRENIYDENVENWTRTVAAGLTANPDNATNVFHLLKSLDVGSWATTKTIMFTRSAGVIPGGTYSLFKMFVKLKAPLLANGNIQVIFLNGAAQQVGSTTLTAAHGFIKGDAGVYQNITVPMTTGPVTRIQIVFSGVGGGAYLDYIQLQGGITNGSSPFITNIFRRPGTDSVYKVINNTATLAFIDSTGGGTGDGWLLTGNAGTDQATNFLGTTDNQGLTFKLNNTFSGRLEYSFLANNSLGFGAFRSNTIGELNNAFGVDALRLNTTGNQNLSFGGYSMWLNTTGAYNVAVGAGSLGYNVDGNRNIGIGTNAGTFNNASKTISIGYLAGNNLAVQNRSIYIGDSTGGLTGSGENEIVIGDSAQGKGSNTMLLGNYHNTGTYLGGYEDANIVATPDWSVGILNSGKIVKYAAAGAATTIYSGNSNLANRRTVGGGGFGLTFNNLSSLNIATDTLDINGNITNNATDGILSIQPNDNQSHLIMGGGGSAILDADNDISILSPVVNINGYTLPAAIGTTNQVLKLTDNAGTTAWSTLTSGTVTSVSGTTNRITSTGGATPVIDISASYVGQSSITTLGTIGTGTWQGTAIGDTYISSAATWNAKQATISVTSPITLTGASVGMVNQGTTTTLLHGNAAGNPSFGAIVNADITNATIDLTTKVTGLLPDANISSASTWNAKRSSTGTTGDLASFSASNTPSNISAVASGSVLTSAGTSTLPVWSASPTLTTSLTVPAINGGVNGNDDITIQGTTSATRTTSYVNLQPSGGNVGIGVSAPVSLLEANGTIASKAANPIFATYDTDNDINALYTGADFNSGGGTISYGTLAINRNPATGTFYNTGRAASQINLESSSGNADIAFYTTTTNNTTPTERLRIKGNGNTGVASNLYIGSATTTPTARFHIVAGTATASTAPIKLTAGTNLTTPEAGAVEFDGTNYFATSSTTRYTLAKTLTNTATLDFGSTAAQSSGTLTITVTGAADGDVVYVGAPNASQGANSDFSAYVSASNTVTVKFNNYSSGAIDPASGAFRVSVIKY